MRTDTLEEKVLAAQEAIDGADIYSLAVVARSHIGNLTSTSANMEDAKLGRLLEACLAAATPRCSAVVG